MQTRHKINLQAPEFQNSTRTLQTRAGTIDKEARTVELAFASEEPVERWYGREILDVSEKSADFTRLNSGGALLMDHNFRDQVGVIVRAWIGDDRKARALVKFSRSERGEEIFQDIIDGIRSLVSVGYVVRKMVLQSVEGDVETHRVTDWAAHEVSIVSVPADPTVGVGRSINPSTSRNMPPENSPATPAAPAAAPAAPSVTVSESPGAAQARQAELSRVRALNAAVRTMVERYPTHAEAIRELGARCAEAGDSTDVFTRSLLSDVLRTERDLAPATQDPQATTLGLKKGDVRKYSILRAIRLMAEHKPLDGAEREFSDEIARRLGYQPRGFFMPEDIVRDRRNQARGLLATSPADGGFTVGSEVLASEFVELLRNAAKVVSLGARVITGLKGDVSIPRQLTGATAYWVAEDGTITNSAATFGQIVARPRRLGTNVPYSKQFLAQTSLDAEAFVVRDSDDAIATEIDRCTINGAGGAQPLGILNLPSGVRSTDVTFGGAATWPKYLEFFSNVATSNALLGQPAYLTTPAAAVKAMSIAKFSGGDIPIWTPDGRIGMFRAEWSNQFPSSPTANQVIFADFSQILIMEWAGRDVVVDPYSAKKDGNVEVCIQRLVDIVIRRGKSISISSDTAAA